MIVDKLSVENLVLVGDLSRDIHRSSDVALPYHYPMRIGKAHGIGSFRHFDIVEDDA